ncbi:MAG: DUF2961 domain-containing protein [Acidobacteriota bacterium]
MPRHCGCWLWLLALSLPFQALAQSVTGIQGLPELKDFKAYRSSSNNPDWLSNDDSKRPIPGETVVIADLQGPGQVNHIWMTVAANEYGWPRLLRLRIYYDGSSTPSVDAPVGDFFAVGHGMERTVESLLVRDSSEGRSRNCYWPMPFQRSCRITVTNEGRRRVSNLYYHVDWQQMKSLPANTGYFHAHYRQALPAAAGKNYEILAAEGKGHYVGTVFSIIQNQPGWFGEGDEFFYVDGESYPSIEGTGSEDYFNDAWGLRVDTGPYAGVPVAEGTSLGSRMCAYRWHLTDPVPFTRSLRFEIEHAGWTYEPDGTVRSAFEERADLISTVAFWYQEGIAKGLPEPPYGAARLPHGNAIQIEVEGLLGQIRTQGGKADVQKEVFWSRDLLRFQAEGPGARLDIPFVVENEGYYELLAQIAHAPDYGVYSPLLDGQRSFRDSELEQEPAADNSATSRLPLYNVETYVAVDHLLGWHKLSKGRHVLSFVCQGKQTQSSGFNLGIDTLVLARVAAPSPMGGSRAAQIRAIGALGAGAVNHAQVLTAALDDSDPSVRIASAWAFTQMGTQVAPFSRRLSEALSDPDPVVRGLAALSLRNAGSAALPALNKLISGLKDNNANVRLMSADAIAQQGSSALPALPALIEACQAPGEEVHVLRNLASALGAIGPQAAPALPALKKLQAQVRVRWSADEAVRKISGGFDGKTR